MGAPEPCSGAAGRLSPPPPLPPPAVLFPSVARAQSSLDDFVRTNLFFHGMDPRDPRDVMRVAPTLAWVEAYIYQLDEANEAVNAPRTGGSCDKGMVGGGGGEGGGRGGGLAGGGDPFAGLREALEGQGLLTPALTAELEGGAEYWALERALTASLAAGGEVRRSDVERAMRLKSFDYRVMMLLVYAIRGAPVCSAHCDYLQASELLVDVADDLFDYEEDVLKNSFNCFRLFVHMYGAERGPIELAKFIEEGERALAEREAAVEGALLAAYRRRGEEAVLEGGGEAAARGAPGGRWSFPAPITDEPLFRRQVAEAEAGAGAAGRWPARTDGRRHGAGARAMREEGELCGAGGGGGGGEQPGGSAARRKAVELFGALRKKRRNYPN